MNIVRWSAAAAAITALTLTGCASHGPNAGFTPLLGSAQGLAAFERVAEANWTLVDGVLAADQGGKVPAYLVTRESYQDFVIRAEVWVSDDANSGIFFRCAEPRNINDKTCYEANFFDQRPDPSYGTGAIVNIAKVNPMPKAGGRWNTMEVTAKGPQLTVVLNGQKTVDVQDRQLSKGPVALQWGRGTVKFRKVEIKAL